MSCTNFLHDESLHYTTLDPQLLVWTQHQISLKSIKEFR
jgi:hypothetical protein